MDSLKIKIYKTSCFSINVHKYTSTHYTTQYQSTLHNSRPKNHMKNNAS